MQTWSTHLLTEFFTAVNAAEDEPSAICHAVERAVEMVEAEVGAVVRDGQVHGPYGFGGRVPVDGLLMVADGQNELAVKGLGELYAVRSQLGGENADALIVARLDEAFLPEERQMLQGMAQVLGLGLRSIRVLSAERHLRAEKEHQASSAQTRQRLVETLLTIQRAISARRPLPEILDAVTSGAGELLGGATVALLLAEAGTSRRLTVASVCGDGREPPDAIAREAMTKGTALVRSTDDGMLIAVPVRVTGEMAGSLVARLPGDAKYIEERDQLAAFAQQVSLALTDWCARSSSWPRSSGCARWPRGSRTRPSWTRCADWAAVTVRDITCVARAIPRTSRKHCCARWSKGVKKYAVTRRRT
ncbi:GAF domain-containing protein [Micromonosporaceae bacterium Da 78-11]